MNIQQMIGRSPFCLLGLLGLTLFASPVAAQVFDNVINVPPDPNIGSNQNFATIQLNIFDGGTVGRSFIANFGSEVNINGGTVGAGFQVSDSVVNICGGTVGEGFDALGSEVNISGGTVGDSVLALSGTVVNISGGTVGDAFDVFGSEVNISGGAVGDSFVVTESGVVNISGGAVGREFAATASSKVNLFGSDFALDGDPLDDGLTVGDALTIVDRDMTLSGLLADGSAFSFNLNSSFGSGEDFFDPDATLTVTLVSPASDLLLCDVNLDGVLNFLDIAPFIASLTSDTYVAEADCNTDGLVNFLDIAPFIAVLAGN